MSRLKWIGAGAVVALVLVLAVFAVLQQRALADLREDVRDANSAADATSAQLEQLESSAAEASEEAPATAELEKSVRRHGEQLAAMCSEGTIGAFRSSLDGQQLAAGYDTNMQYFSNLYSLLDAICGADYLPSD